MNIAGALDKNAMRRVVTGKSITSGGSLDVKPPPAKGCVHCITEGQTAALTSPARPLRFRALAPSARLLPRSR